MKQKAFIIVTICSCSLAIACIERVNAAPPWWPDVKGRPAFQANVAKVYPESSEVKFAKPDGRTLVVSLHDFGTVSLTQLRKVAPPVARKWASADGRFQTQGALLAIDGDDITLWIDNRLPKVPLARLSKADREHVKQVALQRVVDRVVMLKTFDSFDRQLGFGSAFYVDERGWLATNYHVIRGASRIELEIAGRVNTITHCVAVDRANDLAILACAAATQLDPPLRLAKRLPNVGDDVWAVGFPNGLPNSGPGSVGNLPKTQNFPANFRAFLQQDRAIPFPDETQWIQVQQAVVLPGSSGGPLADTSGCVLGVNTWVAAGAFGQAVAASHLTDLVNRARQQPAQMALPLPPAEGEPTTGWLHPEVVSIIKTWQKKSPGLLHQVVQAARGDLMAQAREDPDHWTSKQSAFLVSQVSCYDPDGDRWIADATDLLLRQHAESRAIAELAMKFAASDRPAGGEFCLQVIGREDVAPATRTAACVGLLSNLLWRLDSAQGQTPQQLAPLRKEIDATLQRWRQEFAGESLTLSQDAFGQAQLSYDGHSIQAVPSFLKRSVEELIHARPNEKLQAFPLSDLARGIEHYFEHLSIGAKAQDFCGENAAGERRCLNGLAGKVVLLDFFADWCPPCQSMYPLEHRLETKSREDPKWKGKFKLIGVTQDPVEKIQPKIDAKAITWSICFDKPPQGQPSTLEMYRVNSYPTMMLLDKKGVIRYHWLGVQPGLEGQLQAAIDKLVAE